MSKRDRSLPLHPVAGDLVKLKSERITSVIQACEAAGYEVDPYAIRTVTRVDPYAAGGGQRLYVEGAPHMFFPRDVSLAWNTDDERKKMLVARGWEPDPKSGEWKRR